MVVDLHEHQRKALRELRNGNILKGGVGTGKSITAVAYYYVKIAEGNFESLQRNDPQPLVSPKRLVIITPAQKRNKLEWEDELLRFRLSTHRDSSFCHVEVTVDSWQNISKYDHVRDAFFIFDEQRLVGSGKWVKSFLTIARSNEWILLSATPGDSWMDYAPVFIANGFYKNKTEFITNHVVYKRFAKYPQIDHFVETGKLEKYRRQITVDMPYVRHTKRHVVNVPVEYDKAYFDDLVKRRWNPYTDKPMKDAGELFRVMRQIVNSDWSRYAAVMKLMEKHPKLIIFYNFDYELAMLRTLKAVCHIAVGEWNGHHHDSIPDDDKWLYLVQYTAGSDAWNCTDTDSLVSFSLNYSWRAWEQAQGRIDRLNTPFTDLYYYILRSGAPIDNAITRAVATKQDFNERKYLSELTGNSQFQ